MNVGQFKGALFEFLIRRLLANCGFLSVSADNLYTFETKGLFFINGRGAAHDADVLMDPPVQMPFGYPSRLLFECKAYKSQAGLSIIRNALGLKIDINEFEIVTKDTLKARKSNKKASYAIENRQRRIYQVGVASSEGFSKNAFEFAANNKIPLLSLKWMLDAKALSLYRAIDQQLINSYDVSTISALYKYFKDRKPYADSRHMDAIGFLEEEQAERIGYILSSLKRNIDTTYIGLLESGDLIFLFKKDNNSTPNLQNYQEFGGLRAQLHYYPQTPEMWYLSVFTDREILGGSIADFKFFVPPGIMRIWKEYSLSRSKAIDLKGDYFSKIFIFNKEARPDLPFFVVNLDRSWLDQIAQAETDFSVEHQEDIEPE